LTFLNEPISYGMVGHNPTTEHTFTFPIRSEKESAHLRLCDLFVDDSVFTRATLC